MRVNVQSPDQGSAASRRGGVGRQGGGSIPWQGVDAWTVHACVWKAIPKVKGKRFVVSCGCAVGGGGGGGRCLELAALPPMQLLARSWDLVASTAMFTVRRCWANKHCVELAQVVLRLGPGADARVPSDAEVRGRARNPIACTSPALCGSPRRKCCRKREPGRLSSVSLRQLSVA